MNEPVKLTARQQDILTLIETTMADTGAPPTRAEIATAFGFKSANAAEEHLRALARKGVIELVGNTSRGIRLRTGNHPTPRQMPLALPELQQLTLPLIGRVAAGAPILAQAHVESRFTVEQRLFSRRPDYLLRVRGLSMRDAGILDGDLLAVHSTREALHQQIVVARLGDEVTVKRLVRQRGHVELHPANPDFEPMVVGPDDAFEIEGVMVGLIRDSERG
ncbi:MAG: transcriptional repressor LexA [Hydrogenophaga sp.]|nr:transcriptional repressor LexA [Hydrogenophaga sp.]